MQNRNLSHLKDTVKLHNHASSHRHTPHHTHKAQFSVPIAFFSWHAVSAPILNCLFPTVLLNFLFPIVFVEFSVCQRFTERSVSDAPLKRTRTRGMSTGWLCGKPVLGKISSVYFSFFRSNFTYSVVSNLSCLLTWLCAMYCTQLGAWMYVCILCVLWYVRSLAVFHAARRVLSSVLLLLHSVLLVCPVRYWLSCAYCFV